eukprot:SAG31_NODE_1602_length_7780_cov_8.304699_6_plen_253_part_00
MPRADTRMPLRVWRSDPPHDLLDAGHSGAVSFPFPDVAMVLTAVLVLDDYYSPIMWTVPGSHRENKRHPCYECLTLCHTRRAHLRVNQYAPIPGEHAIGGKCGTVILCDSRLWRSYCCEVGHTAFVVTASYAPWWLSCEFGEAIVSTVPAKVYDNMPAPAQLLFRRERIHKSGPSPVADAQCCFKFSYPVHSSPWTDRAEGVGDFIQHPRPFDGWRQDRAAPRMDNSWISSPLAGVESTFVQNYYAANNARL